jgi:hypothetical protein
MIHRSMILVWCWLLALAAGVAAAQPAAEPAGAPARVALVIGNSSYPDDAAPLAHPLKDAGALAEELRRSRFDVDVRENLTKEGMQRAIGEFTARIKPGSVALLFFSGYGIQAARQSYMIPVSAQIWSEAEVKRDGISIEAVLGEMNARGARVKLLIVDAARRNPFERRFRGFSAGLAALDAPEGTLAIFSAAPGKVANDSGGENSLFLSELLKESRVGDRAVEEIFNHTRVSVSRASKGEQVPFVSSSLADDVRLLPRSADGAAAAASNAAAGGAPAAPAARPPQVATTTPPPAPTRLPAPPPATPAPAPAAPAAAADPELAVRQDFAAAEGAGTRQAWEDFLSRHQSGFYADLARQQLARVGGGPMVAAPRPPASPDPAVGGRIAAPAPDPTGPAGAQDCVMDPLRLSLGNNSQATMKVKQGTECARSLADADSVSRVTIKKRPQHGLADVTTPAGISYMAPPGYVGSDRFVVEVVGAARAGKRSDLTVNVVVVP